MITLTEKGLEIRSMANRYLKHFQKTITDSIPTAELESFQKVSDTISKLINSNKFVLDI